MELQGFRITCLHSPKYSEVKVGFKFGSVMPDPILSTTSCCFSLNHMHFNVYFKLYFVELLISSDGIKFKMSKSVRASENQMKTKSASESSLSPTPTFISPS